MSSPDWADPNADTKEISFSRVLYVLQERHHLGPYFNERRLGEWYPIHSTSNTSVTLKGVLKPGHFYQFRVASVNANGSRGFSRVSKDFTVARRKLSENDPDEKTASINPDLVPDSSAAAETEEFEGGRNSGKQRDRLGHGAVETGQISDSYRQVQNFMELQTRRQHIQVQFGFSNNSTDHSPRGLYL